MHCWCCCCLGLRCWFLSYYQAHLEEIFESFAPNTTAGGAAAAAADGTTAGSSSAQVVQLSLRYSFPQELVQQVGAPQTMWTIIR